MLGDTHLMISWAPKKNVNSEQVTTSDDPRQTGLALPHTANQRSAVSVAQPGPKPSSQTSVFGIISYTGWLIDVDRGSNKGSG